MTSVTDLKIWDNGGESIDRYTVVWPDGTYLAMNNAPFHPQGFGQHGERAEYAPDCEKDNAGDLTSHLGKLISFDDLPPDCQSCVNRDLATEKEQDHE